MYHCWCTIVHFRSSSKCIHMSCEEEMDDVQWNIANIKKLNILIIFESKLKVLRSNLLPKLYV
jgi:hypothetical protein